MAREVFPQQTPQLNKSEEIRNSLQPRSRAVPCADLLVGWCKSKPHLVSNCITVFITNELPCAHRLKSTSSCLHSKDFTSDYTSDYKTRVDTFCPIPIHSGDFPDSINMRWQQNASLNVSCHAILCPTTKQLIVVVVEWSH